jgi:hypothetical protein
VDPSPTSSNNAPGLAVEQGCLQEDLSHWSLMTWFFLTQKEMHSSLLELQMGIHWGYPEDLWMHYAMGMCHLVLSIPEAFQVVIPSTKCPLSQQSHCNGHHLLWYLGCQQLCHHWANLCWSQDTGHRYLPYEAWQWFCHDVTRQHSQKGAMDKLLSDRAQVKLSNKVKDILWHYFIRDWQSKPYHEHHTPAERCYQAMKQ